jgi:hypothetical protein
MSTTVKRLRDDLRWALRRDCETSTFTSGKTLTISSEAPGNPCPPPAPGSRRGEGAGVRLASLTPDALRAPGTPLPGWVALLALIDEFVETWDDPRSIPKRPADAIYRRDGYRCAAPGCTSRQGLEEHHIVYRSHGGGEAESNRVTICGFHHHQGEHGGQMRVTGQAPLGLVWRLGTPEAAEWFRNERRLHT